MILKKYRNGFIICISHFSMQMLYYTQQKEIRSEILIVTKSLNWLWKKTQRTERQGICYEENFKYAE